MAQNLEINFFNNNNTPVGEGVNPAANAGLVAEVPLSYGGNLKKLKSDYFIQKFFDYIQKRRKLKTIRYNKSIQKRVNLNINHYKEFSEKYSSVEIEIKTMENKYGRIINIKEGDEKYYHIYYNDNKKEEEPDEFGFLNFLKNNNKKNKINIIINYQVESFYELFYDCKCIESICFKKFYRNNVTNMSYMFGRCKSLKELNLDNFDTSNVNNMSYMFSGCESLKELNISNFDTSLVIYKIGMFVGCSDELRRKISKLNIFKKI